MRLRQGRRQGLHRTGAHFMILEGGGQLGGWLPSLLSPQKEDSKDIIKIGNEHYLRAEREILAFLKKMATFGT